VTGLRWVLPWYGRKKISLRVRNVTSETLKVNDKRGNPIEIAANIVWRVSGHGPGPVRRRRLHPFVNIQIETGLREVATHYAYDHAEEGEPTLRADAEEVGDRLRKDLQRRTRGGRRAIDEAHLMHLAYAPEIAGSMLKRQQAEAVLAARRTIVAGAVGMVENALQQLASGASSPWTTSARRRWCPTCWWCCAPTARPSPWSTPARCTADPWRRPNQTRRKAGVARS
jgi:hypothetical protein